MEQSENINELAAALAKAQGQITGALKDSSNPFFKSKYADLASCWDACRKPLSENGLAVIQSTAEMDGHLYVVTTLAHASGQWMRGWLPVKTKDDSPQGQGSGLTYARRYALAAIVGLAQIDDDAEAAQGRKPSIADNHERLSQKQIGYAKEFAAAITKALEDDVTEDVRGERIRALRDEMNEDKAVFTAAWELLNAGQRRAFKEYVKQEKAA